jgi:outer membrane protein TolC
MRIRCRRYRTKLRTDGTLIPRFYFFYRHFAPTEQLAFLPNEIVTGNASPELINRNSLFQINPEFNHNLAYQTKLLTNWMKWLLGIIVCTLIYSTSLAQTYSLDHYLEIAKTTSPLLKDLKNQSTLSKLDSLRLRATYRPQVNGSSGALFAPVIGGYGYAGAITNVQTFNALVGVNQAIVTKDNLNTQFAAISLVRDSLTNSVQLSEQDLKRAITAQYITAYGSLQQLKFSRKVVDLLTQEEGLLKDLTRANTYKQADYLTFLVTLKQQKLLALQARSQYKNDYTTLNYLTGIADTAMVELSDPAIHRTLPVDQYSSIFFTKYKIDSLRLVNNRKLLDYTYKPKANIFADGGYNTDFTYQPYKNFGTSFGFSITMPIFDGGQKKLVYNKLNIEEDTRRNYKSFFDVQYRQQIAQLNQQISENENLLVQINEQIKYTESLIKVDTQLLQTGDLKIADLILAVNNYLAVKNLLTQTTISRLQLINQLNYWNK